MCNLIMILNYELNEENSVLLFTIISLTIVTVLISSLLFFMYTKTFPEIERKEEEGYFLNELNKLKKFPSILDKYEVNLSVIIPAYNEESRLPPMLSECISFLTTRQMSYPEFKFEIIVVSDGSKDNTSKIAFEYTKRYGSEIVRVLNLSCNRGKGGAVRLGVISSRGAAILFADADGATLFSDLEKLEDELARQIGVDYLRHPADMDGSLAIVCGSRAHLEEENSAKRSLFRTILMHGFHLLVKVFTVDSIRDTQCGFKLFTREAAVQCFYNLHVERWAFDVEVLYIARKFNIPVAEIPVNWTEIEGSKIVPIFSWLQMGFDLFMIWLRYFIGAWDIRSIKT